MAALHYGSAAGQVGPFLGCSFLRHTCHTFSVQCAEILLVDLWCQCHNKIVAELKAAPHFTKCWQSAVASGCLTLKLPKICSLKILVLPVAPSGHSGTAVCSRKHTPVQCCGCFNVKQTKGTGVFICQQLAHQVSLSLRFNQKHQWTLLLHSDLKMLDIKRTQTPQTSDNISSACTLCWLIVLFNAQCLL